MDWRLYWRTEESTNLNMYATLEDALKAAKRMHGKPEVTVTKISGPNDKLITPEQIQQMLMVFEKITNDSIARASMARQKMRVIAAVVITLFVIALWPNHYQSIDQCLDNSARTDYEMGPCVSRQAMPEFVQYWLRVREAISGIWRETRDMLSGENARQQ
jgi:hypothetical protein